MEEFLGYLYTMSTIIHWTVIRFVILVLESVFGLSGCCQGGFTREIILQLSTTVVLLGLPGLLT